MSPSIKRKTFNGLETVNCYNQGSCSGFVCLGEAPKIDIDLDRLNEGFYFLALYPVLLIC